MRSTLLLLLFASTAQAAPTASFTVRPVQGATCVAPCAVHFDAIGDGTTETTDPTFSREFHSLRFLWDFGDPGAGTWTYSGLPKNRAVGAIAGHLYTLPGTYTARLKVTNPSGESHITSREVVVADPDVEFTSAQTWCFRDADDGTFAGCPLDADADGDCDGPDLDHCFTQADFDLALTSDTDTIGCNANDAATRCLFRRGDTFAQTAGVTLSNGVSPGLIDAFGSGALPKVTGSTDFITFGDRWTVARLDVDRSATTDHTVFRASPSRDNLTVYGVTADEVSQGCFTMDTGAPSEFPNLVAAIELSCERTTGSPPCAAGGDPSCSTSNFLFADYLLWLGGLDDVNNLTEAEYNLRAVHARWAKIAHNRFMGTTSGRNTIQLRAWHGEGGIGQTPTEWWIVSDNVLSQRNPLYLINVCQDAGCNDVYAFSAENQNGIIERNFIFNETTTAANQLQGFHIVGGDITIRNNVVDMQGKPATGAMDAFVWHATNYDGASNDDRIHVFNNTFFRDDTTADAFTFCRDLSAGQTESYCRNNLVYDAGQSGTFLWSSGTWETPSNNLDTGSNPFVADPPEQELTARADFALASPNAATIDAGYDFVPGTDTDRWVYDDTFVGCRPDASAEWDIGADEVGAFDCFLGFPSVESGLGGGASNQGGGF